MSELAAAASGKAGYCEQHPRPEAAVRIKGFTYATPDCYDVGPKGPSQVSHGSWPDPSGRNASGHCQPVTQAQQNYMVQYPTSNNETGYIWTGDRWQSAPDHLKSHDFQYWQPLQWDDSVSPSRLHRLGWVDSFSLELA